MNLLKKSWKTQYVFLAGCLVGAVVFLLIYGPHIVDVTNDGWLLQTKEDITQHYLGWKFYRATSWHVPMFGLVDGLTSPDPVSIMYMDSIPIAAVFFKILSPILPTTFQYIGLWGLACYMLQCGIASIILRRATKNQWVCLAGVLFYLFTTIMLLRMYRHTALASQWILLLAIYLWIVKDEIGSLCRHVLIWSGMLVLCVGIHAYFAPMVMVILLCYALEDLMRYKKILRFFALILIPIVCLLLFMFLLGAFYGEGAGEAPGLGFYSANMNALFNSQGTATFFKGLTTATIGQYEGMAYLGTGVLVMCVVAATILLTGGLPWKKYPRERKRKHILYFVAILIFLILAWSPTVTFFGHTLFTIPYPEPILKVLNIFRASGRFMWPIVYMIMIYVMYTLIRNLNMKQVCVVFAVCVAVQVVDVRPLLQGRRSVVATEQYSSAMQSSTWKYLVEKYDKIIFISNEDEPLPQGILGESYPGLLFDIMDFAVNHHLTLNDAWVAKRNAERIDNMEIEEWNKIKAGQAEVDTMYFFPKEPLLQKSQLYLYQIDGFIVGVKEKISDAGMDCILLNK